MSENPLETGGGMGYNNHRFATLRAIRIVLR